MGENAPVVEPPLLPICVLGALEVTRHGEPVRLQGGQQRRLLAALAMQANDVVSADRLVEVLWGGDPDARVAESPDTLVARLQTQVSRLRSAIGHDRVETRAPGYRLRVTGDDLDALRFEELVRSGLAGGDRRAVLQAFDDALALWRGTPYVEFESEEFATPEVVRLAELHARVIEERSAALLDLDRPEDVIEDLEVEIVAQPFRQRLRALLMLALARSGRQVEALRRYEEFRRFLADEIGVTPSPELQALNDEIVQQYPDVDWSSPPTHARRPARLPTGTVTFLFTDLEGSTRLWEEHPAAMQDALARHDVLLREAIDSCDGYVVKTTGDGIHAVFAAATDALRAAVTAQRALCAEGWGDIGTLRVRIALHTGEALFRDDDYFGSAVNRAARLMGIAHGQQVLVSNATAQVVRDELPADVDLVDLGEHELRDLSALERVFQVAHPALPDQFPPLRSFGTGMTMAVPATSFHGRSTELEELAALVGEPGLVTLVGPGGVGKTRLALELLADVAPRFRDGVRTIDLAPVGADSVPATFAAGLGLVRRGHRTFRDSIVGWLARKSLLLVIDNCEHVLASVAPLLHAIAGSSPAVTILATSRQPFGFPGEVVFPVEPLAIPAPGEPAIYESSPAVRLFVDRASAARRGFELGPGELELVAELCRRLDGIPLAVELAASRARTMGVRDLLEHLHLASPILAMPTPDHPRHRTLMTTIEWSYDLLTPERRALFERLSVFSGSWTLAAARHVCADDVSDEHILALLADLADRSMIVAEFGRAETRYRMLSTLHDFAADRLASAEGARAFRDRHARYYCALAEDAETGLRTSEETRWATEIAAAFGNLNAAHRWAIEQHDVDLDARLLAALWNYGLQRLSAEYFRWVEEALSTLSFDEHLLYADLLGIAAIGAWLRGDLRQSMRACQAAFEAETRLGREFSLPARMAIVVATAYAPPGVNPERDAIAAEAPTRFLEVVEWSRVSDQPYWLVYSMITGSLGMVMSGDVERAAALADRALRAATSSGCPSAIAWAQFAVATALEPTDAETAELLLDPAVRGARLVDGRLVLGLGMSLQATLRRRLGRALEAVPLLLELVDHWDRLSNLPQLWHTVREAAMVLALLGVDDTAASLLAAVDRAELVMPLLPADQPLVARTAEELRDRLGRAAFAVATTTGAALSRAEAVELVNRSLLNAVA